MRWLNTIVNFIKPKTEICLCVTKQNCYVSGFINKQNFRSPSDADISLMLMQKIVRKSQRYISLTAGFQAAFTPRMILKQNAERRHIVRAQL